MCCFLLCSMINILSLELGNFLKFTWWRSWWDCQQQLEILIFMEQRSLDKRLDSYTFAFIGFQFFYLFLFFCWIISNKTKTPKTIMWYKSFKIFGIYYLVGIMWRPMLWKTFKYLMLNEHVLLWYQDVLGWYIHKTFRLFPLLTLSKITISNFSNHVKTLLIN